MKILKHDVSDAVLLGAFTALSYVCVVFYQAGKYSTYGVPATFIDPSVPNIVGSWTVFVPIFTLIVFVELVTILFVVKGVGRLASWLMRQLPKWIVRPLQWLASKSRELDSNTTVLIKTKPLLLTALVITLVVTLTATGSFASGRFIATSRTAFIITTDAPDCLIIYASSDKYVCVDYDYSKMALAGTYHVRDDISGKGFSATRIHRLKFKNTANPFRQIWEMINYLA